MFGPMSIPTPRGEREKLVSSLTPQLRRLLKIRAFEHGMDIQDATEHAIKAWYLAPELPDVDTTGAKTWGTLVPVGESDVFKSECTKRGVTYVKGLAQAVTLWLDNHPSPTSPLHAQPVARVIVANQKGGVGKKPSSHPGSHRPWPRRVSVSCWSTTTLRATSLLSSGSKT
ncbi:hypothetical protein GCM10020254_87660 [Streptomyces goshikiensis]